jgi:hypothetical protein
MIHILAMLQSELQITVKFATISLLYVFQFQALCSSAILLTFSFWTKFRFRGYSAYSVLTLYMLSRNCCGTKYMSFSSLDQYSLCISIQSQQS